MQTPISGFNASAVGAGLRTAMQFGYPVDPEHRPIFVMPAPAPSPDADPTDGFGVPFDPSAPAGPAPTEVTGVLCAYEQVGIQSDGSRSGTTAQAANLVVTLLQEEWLLVQDCVAVRVGGITYTRWRDQPEYALGTLGVHQLVFQAGDVR